jgi:rhomboid protease GluP
MRQRALRFSPTFILIIVNVLVYVYTSFLSQDLVFTSPSVLQVYGQFNFAIYYMGWWWQIVTSMFVHVSIIHLFSNLFFLLIFGLRGESLFTDCEYYFIYLLSGIVGGLFSLVYLFSPNPITSAGASGAIFGLFGAVIIYLRKVTGRPVMGALFFAFIFFLVTLSEGTNIFAHCGGLFTGLIIGYWLAKNRIKKNFF